MGDFAEFQRVLQQLRPEAAAAQASSSFLAGAPSAGSRSGNVIAAAGFFSSCRGAKRGHGGSRRRESARRYRLLLLPSWQGRQTRHGGRRRECCGRRGLLSLVSAAQRRGQQQLRVEKHPPPEPSCPSWLARRKGTGTDERERGRRRRLLVFLLGVAPNAGTAGATGESCGRRRLCPAGAAPNAGTAAAAGGSAPAAAAQPRRRRQAQRQPRPGTHRPPQASIPWFRPPHRGGHAAAAGGRLPLEALRLWSSIFLFPPGRAPNAGFPEDGVLNSGGRGAEKRGGGTQAAWLEHRRSPRLMR